MASRDRKRSSSSSAKPGAPARRARAESTDDALEELFAEAMGSVRVARSGGWPLPEPETSPDDGLEIAVEFEEEMSEHAFLDEQSVHFIMDDEATDPAPSPPPPKRDEGPSFDRLNAELLAALADDEDEEEEDEEDIHQFLLDSFGPGALSDDDPDLAYPSFDEGTDDDSDDLDMDIESPRSEEVIAIPEYGAEAEVLADIGRPAGQATRSKHPGASRAAARESIDQALRVRVAELGRVVEDRDLDLRAARERITNLTAQMVAVNRRTAAQAREFETFRQRAERDREDHKKYAAEKVLKEFLGVFDNLERALAHAGPDGAGAFGQGVSMTLRQFETGLRQNGVERVDGSPGSVFDPVHHEAVGQFFSEDVSPGSILTEMQAGFMLHGRLLRAALVTVSRGPKTTAEVVPAEQVAPSIVDQADSDEAQPEQAETTQADTTQAETTQAETTQAETTQAETTQAETTQAETTQAETTQAGKTGDIDETPEVAEEAAHGDKPPGGDEGAEATEDTVAPATDEDTATAP